MLKLIKKIFHKDLKPKINGDYVFVLHNTNTCKEYKKLNIIYQHLAIKNKRVENGHHDYHKWLKMIEEKLQDITEIKDDELILKDHLRTGGGPMLNYITEEEYDKIAKNIEGE